MRGADINKSEDVALSHRNYLGRPGLDDGYSYYYSRSYLCSKKKAASWELVEANECGKNTYYIRDIVGGDYLSSKPCGDYQHVYLQDDQSKASVVRLKRYRRDLEEWRRNLKIGSEVLFRIHRSQVTEYPKYSYLNPTKKAVFWIRIRVIDTKQTGNFEREIKLEYGQQRYLYVGKRGLKASAKFIGTDASPTSGFPEWVPIGSSFLYNIDQVIKQSIDRSQDYLQSVQMQAMMDRKKRVDRISEERVDRYKKKWKKRKRGNYKKRNERIMRESQQKQRNQKRKCGRKSKYALCY